MDMLRAETLCTSMELGIRAHANKLNGVDDYLSNINNPFTKLSIEQLVAFIESRDDPKTVEKIMRLITPAQRAQLQALNDRVEEEVVEESLTEEFANAVDTEDEEGIEQEDFTPTDVEEESGMDDALFDTDDDEEDAFEDESDEDAETAADEDDLFADDEWDDDEQQALGEYEHNQVESEPSLLQSMPDALQSLLLSPKDDDFDDDDFEDEVEEDSNDVKDADSDDEDENWDDDDFETSAETGTVEDTDDNFDDELEDSEDEEDSFDDEEEMEVESDVDEEEEADATDEDDFDDEEELDTDDEEEGDAEEDEENDALAELLAPKIATPAPEVHQPFSHTAMTRAVQQTEKHEAPPVQVKKPVSAPIVAQKSMGITRKPSAPIVSDTQSGAIVKKSTDNKLRIRRNAAPIVPSDDDFTTSNSTCGEKFDPSWSILQYLSANKDNKEARHIDVVSKHFPISLIRRGEDEGQFIISKGYLRK